MTQTTLSGETIRVTEETPNILRIEQMDAIVRKVLAKLGETKKETYEK